MRLQMKLLSPESGKGMGKTDMKLELKNVMCGYDKQRPVLERVTFTIQTGQICCLLGPNGVGKTTLFKTILGLLPPLEGKVLADGEDTARWRASRLAGNMAYVSQFHNPPFPYKVRDVVLLGRVGQAGYFGKVSVRDYQIVEEAMSDMGISHLRDLPYTDISGGERQLVMIARALAQQPKWLLMDEPTANLDYGNMVRVIEKICQLRDEGYGIVMTTHLPDQAFLCDAMVALLGRRGNVRFGRAADIITEANMRQVYDVDIEIVEMFDRSGRLVRMCVPSLKRDEQRV